jgi:hypothetical protein
VGAQAASLALLVGAPYVTTVDLAGAKLNDSCARAIASAVGPGSVIKTLNLERNELQEAGLLELVSALRTNASVQELRLTGNPNFPNTVEVAFANLLDGGDGEPPNTTIIKLSPAMRNANERRRVEPAISRNMDLMRKARAAASQ